VILGAAACARAAADLLWAPARVPEPAGHGPLSAAANSYDRASRDLLGPHPTRRAKGRRRRPARRRPRPPLLRRAAPRDTTAVVTPIVATAGLAEAVADLRTAQQRHHQAVAASAAAAPLRAAGRATAPLPAPAERARGVRQDRSRRHAGGACNGPGP